MTVPGVGNLNRKLLRSRYKILLIENDRDAIKSITSNLDSRGLSNVVVASTAAAATQQLNEGVDAVLADVLLDPSPQTTPRSKKGDTWLMEHAAALAGRLCAAVTGYPNLIDDQDFLDQHDIRTVIKSSDDEDRLYDELEGRADRKIDAEADKLPALIAGLLAGHPDPSALSPVGIQSSAITEEARGLFLEWLRLTGGQDRADIWVNGRAFTPSNLADEVDAKSDVGEKLLFRFVKHMRNRIHMPTREGH